MITVATGYTPRPPLLFTGDPVGDRRRVNYTSSRSNLSLILLPGQQRFPYDDFTVTAPGAPGGPVRRLLLRRPVATAPGAVTIRRMNSCVITRWPVITTALWPITGG